MDPRFCLVEDLATAAPADGQLFVTAGRARYSCTTILVRRALSVHYATSASGADLGCSKTSVMNSIDHVQRRAPRISIVFTIACILVVAGARTCVSTGWPSCQVYQLMATPGGMLGEGPPPSQGSTEQQSTGTDWQQLSCLSYKQLRSKYAEVFGRVTASNNKVGCNS